VASWNSAVERAWPGRSPELAEPLAQLFGADWARGVPETGQGSCCMFVFVLVDQAAEDIAAVDLLGGWRFRLALAR
jgi:hypothetical protein